jgi:hypothetical protein
MREEAASAGFYESPWGKHPKIQILTVSDSMGPASTTRPSREQT